MNLIRHWLINLTSIFSQNIKKIKDTFDPSGTKDDVYSPSDPPKITYFTTISDDNVNTILESHQQKPVC